eukprot:320702_1
MASWITHFWLILYFCNQTSSNPTLYVSHTGSNTNQNALCSFQSPCASLDIAVSVRENAFANATDPIEIIVSGFNGLNGGLFSSWSTPDISMPLTVTFDTSQHYEWAEISGQTTQLILNNLNYMTHDGAEDIRLWLWKCTFVCNNCTFIGIHMTDPHTNFITAQNIEFYNSTFRDIIWTKIVPGGGFIGTPPTTFIRIWQGTHVIFQNTHFEDIRLWDLSFMLADSLQQITVDNCHFKDVHLGCTNQLSSTEITIICSELSLFTVTGQDQQITTVRINDSAFTNIHSKPLLTLAYSNAIMDNIQIIVPFNRTQPKYMIGVRSTAQLHMNNINVMYAFASSFRSLCDTRKYWKTSYSVPVNCRESYPLVNNEGYVAIHSAYISNDITETLLNQFREEDINAYGFPTNLIFEFRHPRSQYIVDTESVALIDNTGVLNIVDFTMTGIALWALEIRNKGTVIASNLNISYPSFLFNTSDYINARRLLETIPYIVLNEGAYSWYDFTCNDDVSAHCVLDDMNVNSAGVLVIQDSFIVGKGIVRDHFGYIGIYNTVVQNATHLIGGLQSMSLNVIDCAFTNIGYYHSADIFSVSSEDIVKVKEPYSKSRAVETYGDGVFYLNGIRDIVINDNVFYYFPTYSFIYIRNTHNDHTSNVLMSRNTFSSPNFTVDHFEHAVKQNVMEFYNYSDDIHPDALLQSMFGNDFDLIIMEGYIESAFIGNHFERNDDLITTLGKACLRIDGYDINSSVHCVSGNLFYGNALIISNGQITSCIHPELSANLDTLCWTKSGPLRLVSNMNNPDEVLNRMIATDFNIALINIQEGSHVILDQTIISSASHSDVETHAPYNPLSVPLHGVLSTLDMIIDESNHAIELQFSEECINKCSKMYPNSENHIYEFHVYCDPNIDYTTLIGMDTAGTLEITTHTLPSKIFLISSGMIFPGGALDVDFVIYDSHDNIITNWTLQFSVHFTSVDFSFDTTMYADSHRCDMCDEGLYIQGIRADIDGILNQTYTLIASVENDLLTVNNLSFTVIECPTGYGLAPHPNSQCYLCSVGEFSIGLSMTPCIRCTVQDHSTLLGVDCLGADKIRISKNYWVGLERGLEYANYEIISTYCPSNYCNPRKGEYLELRASNELCALNRDPNIPLCGACKSGYSEVFGSTICSKCTSNTGRTFLILFALYIVSIIITVGILFKDGVRIRENVRQISRLSNSKLENYEYKSLGHYIARGFKPILYHYQSLTFVFLNTGVVTQLMSLGEIFNFQLDFGGEATGYCLIPGMSAKMEIILNALIPLYCVFTLLLMGTMNQICAYRVCGRIPHFTKAFFTILLIIVGTICGVCFKLISCRVIGDNVVHFYFGIESCFDRTWCIALVILIVVFAVFCCLFVQLFKDRHQPQLFRRDDYILEPLVIAFKTDTYWYWELVMFSRRFCIAMVNVVTQNEVNAHNLLFTSMLVYLVLQVKCNPFKIHQVNTLEAVCLFCLLSILYIVRNVEVNPNDDDVNASVAKMCLNVLIIAPLMVYLGSIIHMTVRTVRIKKSLPNYQRDRSNWDTLNNGTTVSTGAPHVTMVRTSMMSTVQELESDSDGSEQQIDDVTVHVDVKKCADCGQLRQGKIYAEDGSFYCNACWQNYQ